ncbi:MAG: hypothetical protein WC500_07150 [Candidatus Margulisiibacteriota bacterium]
MNNKQLAIIVTTLIFVGFCVLFTNGVYEFRINTNSKSEWPAPDIIRFNKFTGKVDYIVFYNYEHDGVKQPGYGELGMFLGKK